MKEENNPDDKFVLMGLDDENSKAVSEVMSSKTAKKILNFLGDTKEASEKDIADALNMKLNTVEYNLQKLIKAGFVKKSKNFFWSTKGKKIDMYTLENKHVIIGTKKPSLSLIKSLLPGFFIGLLFMLVVSSVYFSMNDSGTNNQPLNSNNYLFEDKYDLDNNQDYQFSSYNELRDFLKINRGSAAVNRGSYLFGDDGGFNTLIASDSVESLSAGAAPQKAGGDSYDYSGTNIQVENVDEPDIVKTDGEYIYSLSENKVVITKAYPTDEFEIISELNFESDYDTYRYREAYESKYVSNLFVNDKKLILFFTGYNYTPYNPIRCLGQRNCGGLSESFSLIEVYDLSDPKNPSLENSVRSDGHYVDSRMIGDYVYFVSSKSVNTYDPILPIYFVNGQRIETSIDQLYYFGDQDESYVFSSVSSINVKDGEFNTETFLIGSTTRIYSSIENIYLTSTEYLDYYEYQEMVIKNAVIPVVPIDVSNEINELLNDPENKYNKYDKAGEIVEKYYNSLSKQEKDLFNETLIESIDSYIKESQKSRTKTVIHKVSIDDGEISYKSSGKVPGRILNQFSMDEHDSYFRIATTTGRNWFFGFDTSNLNSSNHVYVLNDDLEIVGKIEDLASGETIYSSRFMGDKLYLVTYRRVDPLFVIDLSDTSNPEVLGYLKVPGVSDYLHLYDENTLIGVGRDGDSEGRLRGMQVSLFDVSNFNDPKQIDKFEIGDRGTSSPVTSDHKAFLFDKDKNLMVIPFTVTSGDYSSYSQSAYVFNIDSSKIELRGKITHDDDVNTNEYGRYYYPSYKNRIERSLFIEDVLYTISQSKIKANELDSLDLIDTVVIEEIEQKKVVEPYYYEDEMIESDVASTSVIFE